MNSYQNAELQKIQEIELSILKTVDQICKYNGIHYWVDGGTALGALRHKGFIPWDDDIDIGMLRTDYERFKEVAPNLLRKQDLFLQDYSTEHSTPFSYMKVRLNGTTFIEYNNRNVNMNKGIYIDIFPYDKMPKNRAKRKKLFKRINFWDSIWVLHQSPSRSTPPSGFISYLKSACRYILHLIVQIIPMRFIHKKIESLMTSYNGSTDCFVGYYCSWRYLDSNYDINDFIPEKMKNFEDMEVPVPASIEKFLKKSYGDYMKLPPTEFQVGHKPYKLDFGNY